MKFQKIIYLADRCLEDVVVRASMGNLNCLHCMCLAVPMSAVI